MGDKGEGEAVRRVRGEVETGRGGDRPGPTWEVPGGPLVGGGGMRQEDPGFGARGCELLFQGGKHGGEGGSDVDGIQGHPELLALMCAGQDDEHDDADPQLAFEAALDRISSEDAEQLQLVFADAAGLDALDAEAQQASVDDQAAAAAAPSESAPPAASRFQEYAERHPRLVEARGRFYYMEDDGTLTELGQSSVVGGSMLRCLCSKHSASGSGAAKSTCSLFLDYSRHGVANCDRILANWLCVGAHRKLTKDGHAREAVRAREACRYLHGARSSSG